MGKILITDFRSRVSFFDPNIKTKDGRFWKQVRYDQIVEEQVAISYASKGISISDTDEMTPYDREQILKMIQKIKEAENPNK